MPRALVVLSLLALVACGRSPGPLPEEEGKLSYWLLTESKAIPDECSDSPVLDKWRLEPPDFSYASWYYIYRVHDGGRMATDYDCMDAQAYDPVSCTPVHELVWMINDHTATLDYHQGLIDLPDGCQARVLGRVTLVDGGDKGTVRHEVRFEIERNEDACEAAVREVSPNGKGLRDCVRGLDEVVYFARAIEAVN